MSELCRKGNLRIAEGTNAVRGRDTISRQSDLWFDSVVVEYTKNMDAEGKAFSVYDSAASGPVVKKTRTKVIDGPYPGPGAAALLLARYEGRGRVLDLRALTDLDATPGKTLVATMPGTPVQVGILSNVTWEWSAEGNSDEMNVGSRGLIDTPPTAWLFQPDGYRWDDVPTGQSWPEYETPRRTRWQAETQQPPRAGTWCPAPTT